MYPIHVPIFRVEENIFLCPTCDREPELVRKYLPHSDVLGYTFHCCNIKIPPQIIIGSAKYTWNNTIKEICGGGYFVK